MNSKERVIRTLAFDKPDMIPVQPWILPSVIYKYGKPVIKAIEKYSVDIYEPDFKNMILNEGRFEAGTYTDGCIYDELLMDALPMILQRK